MSGIGNAADRNSVALTSIVGSNPTLPTNENKHLIVRAVAD